MMRIQLLNQFYPPDMAPTGRVLHDLARMLSARGHDVTVLCSRRSYDGGESYAAREERDGVHVRRIAATGFGRRTHGGKAIDYLTFTAALWANLLWARPRPDLILSLTTPPYVGLVGKCAARFRRARHAHWVMDLYPDVLEAHGMLRGGSAGHRFLAWLTRAELQGSCLTLALSPGMSARVGMYLGPGGARGDGATCRWAYLWPEDGLAPWPEGTVNPTRRERGWREDELVCLYSGNMGLGHPLEAFLEAASRIRGEAGKVRWVFAGGGKRRSEVERRLSEDPGLNVELLPYVAPDQLQAHLCSADVHLASLGSDWAGCIVPSKLQAAFAVGRPLIYVGPEGTALDLAARESGGGLDGGRG